MPEALLRQIVTRKLVQHGYVCPEPAMRSADERGLIKAMIAILMEVKGKSDV